MARPRARRLPHPQRDMSRQEAERSTSGRMPVKKKSQDAMFFVKRLPGLPVPHRRTFAEGIVPSAHSDADFASQSLLRLSAYAGSRGTGSPSSSAADNETARQDAERSTGGRTPAKQKSHDAMFCVKRTPGPPVPHRRAFAEGIVPSAHSDADFASQSLLRLSAYAGSRGTGSPSSSASDNETARQEAERSTSGRSPRRKNRRMRCFS